MEHLETGDSNNGEGTEAAARDAGENCSEKPTSKDDDTSVSGVMSVYEQISARNSVRWSMFVAPEDVERLVSALNSRGVRESALKQIISDQSLQISDFISRCDVDALCGRQPIPSLAADAQSTAELKLEESLREALLDLEERIFTGNLGNLKVFFERVMLALHFFSGANLL